MAQVGLGHRPVLRVDPLAEQDRERFVAFAAMMAASAKAVAPSYTEAFETSRSVSWQMRV